MNHLSEPRPCAPARAGWSRRQWLGGGSGLALLGALGAWPRPGAAEPTALEAIRARGTLSVAVYTDNPPFFEKGKGIDQALAQALADELGLKLSLLPFAAGENMGDDLRNMVWKGHYLGYGPADVMLHVPVDRPLIESTPQVSIFAPYYRERVMIARDVQAVPEMASLEAFKGRKIAVPGQTLAGWLLIGADQGAYREQLLTKWQDGVEAAQALTRGEVVAAAGLASELESVLAGQARYVIEPLPIPRAPKDGWVVGCAVKKSSADLAQALQAAMNKMGEDGRIGAMFKSAGVEWRRP